MQTFAIDWGKIQKWPQNCPEMTGSPAAYMVGIYMRWLSVLIE